MEISLIPILISCFSLLISIGLAVYNGYNSNRLKRLEASLEVQKNKSLLNDKKNREAFEVFITTYVKMLFANKDNKKVDEKELETAMMDVKKMALMNGSGSLVEALNKFTLTSQKEKKENLELIIVFEELLRIYREEIGVDNKNLSSLGLLQLLVKDNINKL